MVKNQSRHFLGKGLWNKPVRLWVPGTWLHCGCPVPPEKSTRRVFSGNWPHSGSEELVFHFLFDSVSYPAPSLILVPVNQTQFLRLPMKELPMAAERWGSWENGEWHMPGSASQTINISLPLHKLHIKWQLLLQFADEKWIDQCHCKWMTERKS